MRHKKTSRIVSCILLIVLLSSSIGGNLLFAADPTVLMPPQKNHVSDIGYIQNLNSRDWYAKLSWEPVSFPPEADERYITLGLNEVTYGGKLQADSFLIPLPGGATEFDLNEYSPEGLRHGAIYESYVKAMYKDNTPTGQYTVNSQKSNPARFLTGLHVSLELIPGTNDIKIKWDDVWDTSGRINYRILISDTKGFTQPPPIPDIVASDIGKSGSAVTVNTAEKKLEYIYNNAMPGREYAIKVVPLPSSTVSCATVDEIGAVSIKTDILLKAKKVGFNNEGDTIWKLFWNPIVKGNTFTRVDYELYRYTDNEPQGQLYRLIPDIDSYQITVKKDDPVLYSFKIDAKAYVTGTENPIEFRSNNKVILKEQIPQMPQAPDIVEAFSNADPVPITYEGELTSSKAAILWTVPYTGDGLVDNDITYDIYLTQDIKSVSSPASNFKIASDLTMSEANQVKDKQTGKVIGYKYNLEGLKSNSTYYFIIYAKKSFLVESPQDGFMITMPYLSKQAVKVIVTKPDTGNDRPVAPPAPPFGVKPGTDSIKYTDAKLVIDKMWYALYNAVTKRWESVSKDAYTNNDLLKPSDVGYENKRSGMIVNYMPGWKVVPHVVAYNDALNAIRLRNNRDSEFITYSDLSQPDIKAFEISQQKVTIPEIELTADQTFEFSVSGLTHNTAYLVWVTIENQNGSSSDPSDPVIITTPPQIPDIPVTPTVPNDLKGIASDSFIDLFWTYVEKMDYEIKGGTSDDIESATITKAVTYNDIKNSTFCRIEELKPDTVYYFWIKAISKGSDNQLLESEYSNPLAIKTEAYKPPAPPAGFGIKPGADGVTEKSITYLWTNRTGFEYYLEFSDNANFENVTLTQVSGGTHTVSGLVSNRRYYARLYAHETKTNLRSEPTRAIMVITNRSKNEYDASYDLDDKVTGNGLVIPTKNENGVWTVTSLGANAHVLGERIRDHAGPVVQLDISQVPYKTSTIRLDLGYPVIDVLSDTGKELYVKLPWGQFLLRPGTFQSDEYYKQKKNNNNLAFRFETITPASSYKPANDMQIKTPVTDFKVMYRAGSSPIQKLAKAIRVEMPVSGLTSFAKDQIKAYSYNSYQGWYTLPTLTDYAQSQVVGELEKPGPIVAAATGVTPSTNSPLYITQSMEQIQAVFELKSLKGKSFNASASITQKDALKLIFDVIPAEFSDADIIQKAVSAKLIKSTSDISGGYTRRDKAVEMLISMYKFKTRESILPTNSGLWAYYKDMNKVDSRYLNSFRFALENGIVEGNGSNLLYPDKLITYGDFLVMLERTLKLCGEL